MIQGFGHLTFSVSDLERSVRFYRLIFETEPVYLRGRTAYFETAGLWIALNEERDIPRAEIRGSYTHFAFSAAEKHLPELERRLRAADAEILPGRSRDEQGEGRSLYFRDPDGHLLEFHTGTLGERLEYYRKRREVPRGEQ
ncbi:metallothiol transferase FosB [Saccharibacillus sp. CPCC 101409]|uniref:metallothiol transferase FosB n=1 Tax=Saccharibacillus sp. CPCC 101409 TaxID=3058041 RepID=UPI0026717EE0|nr:metallothiol transferase FosB [Saccharibacillus sp. CPCC 101409]MDO3410445.1 metallothiol transferase FosB [Saccharibacillus sp. CPCC 101409]